MPIGRLAVPGTSPFGSRCSLRMTTLVGWSKSAFRLIFYRGFVFSGLRGALPGALSRLISWGGGLRGDLFRLLRGLVG